MKERENLTFLCTIHVPLTNNDDVVGNNDDDGFHGVHTLEDEANVITISNIAIFCSRGISANRKCTQVRSNELVLRKTKVNERYPIKGIFLYKWPYDDHGQQDQLSNITMTSLCSLWQQQQQPPPPPSSEDGGDDMMILAPFAWRINTLSKNVSFKDLPL